MGVWEDVATGFTETRKRLGTLDRPAPVRRPQPAPVEPRPRPAQPRAITPPRPPEPKPREQVTESQIQALGELQQRGRPLGIDTTQLIPREGQSVDSFIGDVGKTFDIADTALTDFEKEFEEAIRTVLPPDIEQPQPQSERQSLGDVFRDIGRSLGRIGIGDLFGAAQESGIGEAFKPVGLAMDALDASGRHGLAAVLNAIQNTAGPGNQRTGRFHTAFNEAQNRLAAEAGNPASRLLAGGRALNEPGVSESAPQIGVPLPFTDLSEPNFHIGLSDLGEAAFDVSNFVPVLGGTKLFSKPLRLGAEGVEAGIRGATAATRGLPQRATDVAGRILPERKVFAAGVEGGDIVPRRGPKIRPEDEPDVIKRIRRESPAADGPVLSEAEQIELRDFLRDKGTDFPNAPEIGGFIRGSINKDLTRDTQIYIGTFQSTASGFPEQFIVWLPEKGTFRIHGTRPDTTGLRILQRRIENFGAEAELGRPGPGAGRTLEIFGEDIPQANAIRSLTEPPAPAARQADIGREIVTPKTTVQRAQLSGQTFDANDIPRDPEAIIETTAHAEANIIEAVPAVDKISEFLVIARAATKKTADEIAANRKLGAAKGREMAKGFTDPVGRMLAFRRGMSGLRADRQIIEPLADATQGLSRDLPIGGAEALAPTEAAQAIGITTKDFDDLYRAVEAKWPMDSGQEWKAHRASGGLTKVLLGELPQPGETKLLRAVFGESFISKLLARRPGKAGEIAYDLLFLFGKTLRSSMDASAMLRQLVIFSLNPRRIKQTAATTERMFRVGFTRGDSQLVANQFNDELVNPIKNRHATRLLDPEAKNQIALHDISETGALQFTDKEEVYASNITAMLPKLGKDVRSVFGRRLPKPVTFGIKTTLLPVRIVGSGIRRSELMYATAINQMRMRVAGATLDNWDEVARLTGKPVERESVDVLIDGINVFTGRGHLGPLGGERMSRTLNAIFWAPKLAISRFQAPLIGARGIAELGLTGVAKVTRADPESLLSRVANSPGARARKELAKDLVAFVGTGTTILAALDKFGIAEVETDPRSSDFGKAKFGNVRVDFWGGFQQPARYVAQAITGTQKRLSGKDKGEIIRLGSFFATLEEEKARAAGVGRTRRGPKSEPTPVPPPERLDLLWRFLQSKVAPGVTALTVNELRGQTFIGDVLNEPAPLFGEDLGPTTDVRTREAIQQLIPLFAIDIIEAIEDQGVGRGMAFGVGAALGVGVQTFGEEGSGRFDEDKDDVEFELRRSAIPSAEDNWAKVSVLLNVGDLTALRKVWDGETISRDESASLRKVFNQEPLGQSNFRTWMKQTLRQVQQNAAIASRARESREFATV